MYTRNFPLVLPLFSPFLHLPPCSRFCFLDFCLFFLFHRVLSPSFYLFVERFLFFPLLSFCRAFLAPSSEPFFSLFFSFLSKCLSPLDPRRLGSRSSLLLLLSTFLFFIYSRVRPPLVLSFSSALETRVHVLLGARGSKVRARTQRACGCWPRARCTFCSGRFYGTREPSSSRFPSLASLLLSRRTRPSRTHAAYELFAFRHYTWLEPTR